MSDDVFESAYKALVNKIPMEKVMHDLAVAYAERTAPADVTPEVFLRIYKKATKNIFYAHMTGANGKNLTKNN